MCSHVILNVTGTTEGFPTLLTLIGLLSSVSGLMVSQGSSIFKGFATLFTFIKFFFGVAFFVVSQGIHIGKSFPTHLTFVRPGSTVCP